MIFEDEKQRKINDLYTRLQDLKEGKKILESAMHKNFYNRPIYDQLFHKLDKIIVQINQTKKELAKEKDEYEKSR